VVSFTAQSFGENQPAHDRGRTLDGTHPYDLICHGSHAFRPALPRAIF